VPNLNPADSLPGTAGLWRLVKVFALGLPPGAAGGGVYTLQQPDQYPLVPAGPVWRAARCALLGLRGPARPPA
jgi:hypothetical protein